MKKHKAVVSAILLLFALKRCPDRGYVLETGRIVLSGNAAELLENDEVKKAYLGG